MLIVFLLFMSFCQLHALTEKPMVIVIPSRNNTDVCIKNLKSVFTQTYENYSVIYIDDSSDDNTNNIVRSYITQQNQWHRCTLITNPVRCGHMYNHWMAVHMCSPDTIIINLDGDDWFAHTKVLQKLNTVYADPTIWMTYGQYEEYPYGKKGHCKKIPDIVFKEHAYRYYDWVTSHLRTFYAGLFKQIPLGYFLHQDNFQPSAVDHSMMFSMLELSDGRVKFIDDILYMYNCHNPDNIFRKNVLQQITMSHISRNRTPLPPLTYAPYTIKEKKIQDTDIGVLYFSSDQPKALQFFLESWHAANMDNYVLHVLYEASDQLINDTYKKILETYPKVHGINTLKKAGVKSALADTLEKTNYLYILCASDGCIIKHSVDLSSCASMIHKTHARGFYLGLGKNITHSTLLIGDNIQPPLVTLEHDICAWKFKHAYGAWSCVYTTDCALYTIESLKDAIDQSLCKNYEQLCAAWQLITPGVYEDIGLCFEQSAIYRTNNPDTTKNYDIYNTSL